MSAVPHPAIPPAVWQDVQPCLDAIEAAEGVRILLAVESGSRAWGFPSPDSDYDIRFVYVRSRDSYLRLRPQPDVIETPIEDDIDLNGWDLRKALGLLLKSNAIIGEWMASPICYRAPDPVVAGLRRLADAVCDPRGLAHHYASLARTAADRWLDGDGPVAAKKYFYALRPALAIRWLRLHPGLRPPMHLEALVAGADLSAPIVAAVETLVEAKRRTKEKGEGIRIGAIDALIRDELQRVAELPKASGPSPAQIAQAEQLFLDVVNR